MDDFGKVMHMPQSEARIFMDNKTIQGEYKGIPVVAKNPNDYVDAADVETCVIGTCKLFNLSKEEDRTEYADLLAKIAWSPNIEKCLEERTFVNNELVVYIAYLEYIKIAE
jgi:hypothetical protein